MFCVLILDFWGSMPFLGGNTYLMQPEQGQNTIPPANIVHWWDQNWRKGGLQERRLQILKEFDFYNQLYCGCEFSMRKDD